MKVTLKLVGSYMCKNPPIVLVDVTYTHQKENDQKYVFNTPPDVQRNLQAQFSKIYGTEVIMFTKFSHDVLTGLVSLIITAFQNKKKKLIKFRLYGTKDHFQYFKNAKYHLNERIFGISYCCWNRKKSYRLGILDENLFDQLLKSNKFAQYVTKINWKLEKQDKNKVNDCRINMRDNQKYFEDSNIIIRPFFELDPHSKEQNFYNSVTNYLCIFKQSSSLEQFNESFQRQNGQGPASDLSAGFQTKKATLIMTYRSVQQIRKILKRQDGIQQFNQGLGLRDYIIKHSQQDRTETSCIPKIKLETIVHIIDDPQLIYSCQFYQLFGLLDSLCYAIKCQPDHENSSKSNNHKAAHLFYGYGLKSSTTNIHFLMNTYYKAIRFYSICSKLVKFMPNITYNQFNYWSKIYDNDFMSIGGKIQQLKLNPKKSLIEVYKPIHELNIVGEITKSNSEQIDAQGNSLKSNDSYVGEKKPYQIPPFLLKHIRYPLFSNSLQYSPTNQIIKSIDYKSKYLKYTNFKKKSAVMTKESKLCKQFDPNIIFLGTNSKEPTDLRNVSGILLEVEVPGFQTLFLLDCGTGTYEQLVYHYSPEDLNTKILNLRVIFMSHLHADHNLGVLDLISRRNKLMKQKFNAITDKLILVLPFNMIGWIHFYCQSVENIMEGCHIMFTQTLTNQKINIMDDFFEQKRKQNKIERVKFSQGKLFKKGTEEEDLNSQNKQNKQKQQNNQNQDFCNKYIRRQGSFQDHAKTLSEEESFTTTLLLEKYTFKQAGIKQQFDMLLKRLRIKRFLPSKVYHCPQSYGVIIQHQNGLKVSYSGDCRPTAQFLEEAKQSTLLIHEATFQTSQPQRAMRRLHSTFHEALEAGYSSKSSNICLTHFTSGVFDRDLAETFHEALYKTQILQYYKKSAIIACDHLEFRLSDMQEAGKVSKIISHLGTNKNTQKNDNPLSSNFAYKQQRMDLLD